MKNGKKKKPVSPIYIIGIIFLIITLWSPILSILRFVAAGALVALGFFLVKKIVTSKNGEKGEEKADQTRRNAGASQAAQTSTQTARRSDSAASAQTASRTDAIPKQYRQADIPRPVQHTKPKYPPEVQEVVDAGEKAHEELTRLYASIPDLSVKRKVQEIIDISDKIVADAVEDPSDVPQIKKFMDYYLPTTIKLLRSYERMSAQGIEGKNISKTMESINEMLDSAIDAYKKLLDSLFANQAMDVETDIQVMNTLLRREGFSGGSAFQMKEN